MDAATRMHYFGLHWSVRVRAVPSAATALLAANCSSAGAMLQKVGRVLRPAPGKSFAVCVDLIGMTLDDVYGLPTADRVYSLTGRAIAVEGAPLKCCPKCGSTIPAGMPMCDGFMPDGSACGYVFEKRPHRLAKIYNLELQEAVDRAGGDIRLVSREAKINEAVALLRMARTNGYDILRSEEHTSELQSPK